MSDRHIFPIRLSFLWCKTIIVLSNLVIPYIFDICPPCKECQIDESSADVIDFALGIIYNISKEGNVEGLFEDEMPILHSYKNAEREDFAAMSVMILAHLSGGEAEKIQDEKGILRRVCACVEHFLTHFNNISIMIYSEAIPNFPVVD